MSKSVSLDGGAQTPPVPDYLTKTEDFIHGAARIPGAAVSAVSRFLDDQKSSGGVMGALERYTQNHASHSAILNSVVDLNKKLKDAGLNELADSLNRGISTALITGAGGVSPESIPSVPKAPPDVAPASPPSVAMQNPFRSATSKIEPAVAGRAAKAGLPEGTAEITPEAARAQTAQAATEAQATTQANMDQALQNIATRHAAENRLPAPAAGTASRDIITNSGNALVDAGKADYATLDKFTDGKFTNAQTQLKNAQLELQQKAGMAGVDITNLEANVTRAQMNVDNLFDNAVENGMPEDTAEAARTKFRTGQATLDAGNAVRMANRVTGAGVRATNLNTLENRWTALYDSGRLQQAFGEEGAKDALAQVHSARVTGELFSEIPATETQALKSLIAKNTTTGKFGTSTDWVKVRKDFSDLPNRSAQFSDVPKVEKFINNQATYQRLRGTIKWGVGALAGSAVAREGWKLAE
jgi:hypothetical protein